MSIITGCAKCLNQGLINWATLNMPQGFSLGGAYVAGVDITNGKSYLFNACTIALIACAVFKLCGSMSTVSALTLGAFFYFGRRVADESFNVMIPNFVKHFAPNIAKPRPWLSFGEIVIFYNTIPYNPFD